MVRELDRDFQQISDDLDEQSLRRLKTGTLICAALATLQTLGCAITSFLPILPPLLAIQQIIWARPLISAPYAKYFSPSRRIVTRWLSRFFVFSMAALHTGGALPGGNLLQIVASPMIFVITCGTTWAYHRFHLQREHDREPVMFVEKVLLFVGAACALLALAGLILVGLVVGGVLDLFTK